MPMPAPNTPWPPEEYAPALEAIRRDDALISGAVDVINERRAKQYGRPYTHRTQFNGGVVGAASRAFFGKPQRNTAAESHLVTHHLPIADELTTALADYMAGKPPQAKLSTEDEGNTEAAEALDRLVSSDRFAADWWGAVYRAGSHGWAYGRVVWNQSVDPHPWIEWVDADNGMAEFENGRQTAILFWDTYQHDDDYYRLLQRHTPGQIEYQLFKGSDGSLGYPVPYDEIPEAAYLMDLEGLQDGTVLPTGSGLITADMLSNYRPRHAWRQKKLLRYYHTSDVARAAGIFENIDHNWSQLQHEVEAARGRLFVSEELLESDGPGQGSYLDWFRDVYKASMSASVEAKPTFEQIQFDMRVEQYLTLIDSGIRKAISALGLSPFTVDMDAQATGEMTATETRARTRRTRATADTKGRHERAHLSHILTAYLHMDALLNGYAPPKKPVVVSLPDQIEVSEQELTGSVTAVYTSGLMSIRAALTKLHPEWTPEEVEAEELRIKQDQAAAMPQDPMLGLGEDMAPLADEE